MRTLFAGVRLWAPEEDRGLSTPLDVLVEGSRITAVGAPAEAATLRADRVIDARGEGLLLPGLINAHFHSPANHLKGAMASMPLEVFMLYESPADESLRPSPREAYLRTMIGAIEMLRSGTTSVQDDAFLMPSPEPEVIDAIAQAYVDAGIRATIALDQPELPEADKLPPLPGLDDRWRAAVEAPPALSRPELLERYDYLFSRWHGAAGDRIRAAVSVSAPQRVSPEYFQALAGISRAHGTPLFAHMLETKVQRTLAVEQPRFAGRSLVRYVDELGLLDERTNVIHAVWVSDDDLDRIARAGAVVVHNPVSNLRLGSGIMPMRAVRQRGIPIALGVDEAICNDASEMWNVVKTAGLVHNITGAPHRGWPAATEILGDLWNGGAAAMRRADQLGKVAPGYLADLVLLDLRSVPFTPLNDVAGQLVYCESGRSAMLTMVDGVIVAEGGHVTSVAEDDLLAEARELFADRRAAWRKACAVAEPVVAAYQSMVERAAGTDVGLSRWVAGA